MKIPSSQRHRLADWYRSKQKELEGLLFAQRMRTDHPSVRGDVSEQQWHSVIKQFLPGRYEVRKGFVFDHEQAISEEIDLVVFDRQYSPLLFEDAGRTFIPAEAVYAVFEVKPDLSKSTVQYALGKVESVRRLRRTSVEIPYAEGVHPPKAPGHIFGYLLAQRCAWKPPFGNSFKRIHESVPVTERLDGYCVLDSGSWSSVPVFDQKDWKRVTCTASSEMCLIVFLYKCLEQLRTLGTVPAIDYGAYLRCIGDHFQQ